MRSNPLTGRRTGSVAICVFREGYARDPEDPALLRFVAEAMLFVAVRDLDAVADELRDCGYDMVRTMARDQEPVRDDELEAAKQRLDALREQVRKDLAADLGGDPEDYNANTYHVGGPVADSGTAHVPGFIASTTTS